MAASEAPTVGFAASSLPTSSQNVFGLTHSGRKAYGSAAIMFAVRPGGKTACRANPRRGTLTTDFDWMRTVTPAEAEYSRKRLLAWAQSDSPSNGGTLGDWIFGARLDPEAEEEAYVESKTSGAVQRNWRVPAEFPLPPRPGQEKPLDAYLDRLDEFAVFAVSRFGQTKVVKAALGSESTALFVLGRREQRRSNHGR